MVFRAALIGCGKIGSEFDDHPRVGGVYSHAGAYSACPQTELVAVCDTNQIKAKRCGERWKVKATFSDAQEMLRETRPDIVSICAPDPTHYELLLATLKNDGVRAIFAEKPLAMELDQANEVVAEANRRSVLLAVNYTRRYSESYVELRHFLKSDRIGKIQNVSGYYTRGIIHNGTHWIDLAQFLIGRIVSVRALSSNDQNGPDPTLSGVIDFTNGAGGCLQGCTFEGDVSLFEMDIIGTQGRAVITDSGRTITFYELSDDDNYAGFKTFVAKREADGGLALALPNAVKDIVEALTTHRAPRCSGQDAVSALRVACALVESGQSGNPIRINQN